jgi:cytochrome c biogenesis factor
LYNFCYTYVILFCLIPFKIYAINSTALIDFSYRHNANDQFFNFYSIFWTNTWYFLIFFTLLIIFLVNTVQCVSAYYTVFVLALLGCYILEIYSFYYTNNCFKLFNNFLMINNFLLLNVLNKYHPFFFYTNLAFLLCVFGILVRNFNKPQYIKNDTIIKLYDYTFVLFSSISLSLILGSWWAVQEGSWGGWWNWDPSENFGLVLFLIAILFIHFLFNETYLFLIKYFYINYIYLYLLIYCLLQINYNYTSHNFGLKFFYFFNNNWFLTEIFNVLSAILLLTLINNFSNFYKLYLFNQINVLIYFVHFKKKFNVVFLFVLFLILLISFKSLLTFFFWNILILNSFNINVNFNKFIFLLFIIIITYFSKINIYNLIFGFSLILTFNYYLFFFALIHLFTSVYLLHFSFYLLYFINKYLTNFIVYSIYELNDWIVFFHLKNLWEHKFFNCDSYFLYTISNHIDFINFSTNILLEYLIHNNNFLKVLYQDTIQLTKTTLFFNTYTFKIYNLSNEFYNEILLILLSIIIIKWFNILVKSQTNFKLKNWTI